MFKPHSFSPVIEGIPKIVMSREAYNDMAIIVDEVTTEVGWLGSAYKRGSDLFISKIYLMEQQVHATTTELSPAGIAKTVDEILKLPNGMEEANALMFWGHSHVNMDTRPSGQDEDQMKLFKDNGCDWAIRGIFNKKKKASFDVFFFKLGWIIRDCEWEVASALDDSSRERWKSEIKDKVAPLTYTSSGPGGGSSWNSESYDVPSHCTACSKKINIQLSSIGCRVVCPYCKTSITAIPTQEWIKGRVEVSQYPRRHRSGGQQHITGPGYDHRDPKFAGFQAPNHSGFDKDYPTGTTRDVVTEQSGEIVDDEYWFRPPPRPTTPAATNDGSVAGDTFAEDGIYPSLDEVLARHNDAIKRKNGLAGAKADQSKLSAPVTGQATSQPAAEVTVKPDLALEDPTNPETKVSDK